MKIKLLIYAALATGIMLSGCEKDNYDPPSSLLQGEVVYNDQPIGLKSGRVELELWQPNAGYELFTKIPVMVAQDGSFSATLFDGDYKMTLIQGNGPWLNSTDSIDVQVRGNTIVDMPVTPYYTISAQEYTRTGNVLRGYFNVNEVAGEREIEQVNFYIGETMILDNQYNAASATTSGARVSLAEPNILSVDLDEDETGDLARRDYVFARGAVKITGVEERIYTPVVKILLNEAAE